MSYKYVASNFNVTPWNIRIRCVKCGAEHGWHFSNGKYEVETSLPCPNCGVQTFVHVKVHNDEEN